jgi:hypothetical protein
MMPVQPKKIDCWYGEGASSRTRREVSADMKRQGFIVRWRKTPPDWLTPPESDVEKWGAVETASMALREAGYTGTVILKL